MKGGFTEQREQNHRVIVLSFFALTLGETEDGNIMGGLLEVGADKINQLWAEHKYPVFRLSSETVWKEKRVSVHTGDIVVHKLVPNNYVDFC